MDNSPKPLTQLANPQSLAMAPKRSAKSNSASKEAAVTRKSSRHTRATSSEPRVLRSTSEDARDIGPEKATLFGSQDPEKILRKSRAKRQTSRASSRASTQEPDSANEPSPSPQEQTFDQAIAQHPSPEFVSDEQASRQSSEEPDDIAPTVEHSALDHYIQHNLSTVIEEPTEEALESENTFDFTINAAETFAQTAREPSFSPDAATPEPEYPQLPASAPVEVIELDLSDEEDAQPQPVTTVYSDDDVSIASDDDQSGQLISHVSYSSQRHHLERYPHEHNLVDHYSLEHYPSEQHSPDHFYPERHSPDYDSSERSFVEQSTFRSEDGEPISDPYGDSRITDFPEIGYGGYDHDPEMEGYNEYGYDSDHSELVPEPYYHNHHNHRMEDVSGFASGSESPEPESEGDVSMSEEEGEGITLELANRYPFPPTPPVRVIPPSASIGVYHDSTVDKQGEYSLPPPSHFISPRAPTESNEEENEEDNVNFSINKDTPSSPFLPPCASTPQNVLVQPQIEPNSTPVVYDPAMTYGRAEEASPPHPNSPLLGLALSLQFPDESAGHEIPVDQDSEFPKSYHLLDSHLYQSNTPNDKMSAQLEAQDQTVESLAVEGPETPLFQEPCVSRQERKTVTPSSSSSIRSLSALGRLRARVSPETKRANMITMRWIESGLKNEALEAEMTALKQEMTDKNAELDSVKKELSIAQAQSISLDEICMRHILIMHSETEILKNALRELADDLDAFKPKTTNEVEEFKTSTRRMLSLALLESDTIKHKVSETPVTPTTPTADPPNATTTPTNTDSKEEEPEAHVTGKSVLVSGIKNFFSALSPWKLSISSKDAKTPSKNSRLSKLPWKPSPPIRSPSLPDVSYGKPLTGDDISFAKTPKKPSEERSMFGSAPPTRSVRFDFPKTPEAPAPTRTPKSLPYAGYGGTMAFRKHQKLIRGNYVKLQEIQAKRQRGELPTEESPFDEKFRVKTEMQYRALRDFERDREEKRARASGKQPATPIAGKKRANDEVEDANEDDEDYDIGVPITILPDDRPAKRPRFMDGSANLSTSFNSPPGYDKPKPGDAGYYASTELPPNGSTWIPTSVRTSPAPISQEATPATNVFGSSSVTGARLGRDTATRPDTAQEDTADSSNQPTRSSSPGRTFRFPDNNDSEVSSVTPAHSPGRTYAFPESDSDTEEEDTAMQDASMASAGERWHDKPFSQWTDTTMTAFKNAPLSEEQEVSQPKLAEAVKTILRGTAPRAVGQTFDRSAFPRLDQLGMTSEDYLTYTRPNGQIVSLTRMEYYSPMCKPPGTEHMTPEERASWKFRQEWINWRKMHEAVRRWREDKTPAIVAQINARKEEIDQKRKYVQDEEQRMTQMEEEQKRRKQRYEEQEKELESRRTSLEKQQKEVNAMAKTQSSPQKQAVPAKSSAGGLPTPVLDGLDKEAQKQDVARANAGSTPQQAAAHAAATFKNASKDGPSTTSSTTALQNPSPSDDATGNVFPSTQATNDSTSASAPAAPAWTQPPPPAPLPAHAQLPQQKNGSASPAQSHKDKLERAKAQANRYPSKNPTPLREVATYSPDRLSSHPEDRFGGLIPPMFSAGSVLNGVRLPTPPTEDSAQALMDNANKTVYAIEPINGRVGLAMKQALDYHTPKWAHGDYSL